MSNPDNDMKRDESVQNLNDLLDSLNKSTQEKPPHPTHKHQQKGESSTASEVNGSNSEEKEGKHYSNEVSTPKIKKNNAWARHQKSKSGSRNEGNNSECDDLK